MAKHTAQNIVTSSAMTTLNDSQYDIFYTSKQERKTLLTMASSKQVVQKAKKEPKKRIAENHTV